MKRGTKMILQGALIVTVFGLILSLGALAAARFDISHLIPFASQTVEPPTLTPSVDFQEFNVLGQMVEEPFSNITVDAQTCNVNLVPSSDGTCQVEYPTDDQLECSVSVQQDTLHVVFRDHRSWDSDVSFSLVPMDITLYLPQSQYEQLKLDSVSGDITVPENFSFSKAQVGTTSGKLQFYAGVSGDLALETVSGDLEVTHVEPKSLSLTSTSGSMDASYVAVMETWDIDSVSGEVTLTDCDAQALVIRTISGDVKASLRTDKTFSTQTVSGDVDVPSGTSGSSCKVSTVSGDITCTIQ